MAAGQLWKCTNCGNEICTSSLHDFYRDDNGNFKTYNHPGGRPGEDAKPGSGGSYVKWYCPNCKEIKVAVKHEYGEVKIMPHHKIENTLSDSILFTPTCDKCGTELKQDLDHTDVCPKCNDGFFVESGGWIS